MAMTYTTLTDDKSTTGSLKAWVNYSKLDAATVLDEAQALLYMTLRTREMLTQFTFSMGANASQVSLPSRFLDPVGRIRSVTSNRPIRHKTANFIQDARSYAESSGSLGSSPFTTTDGSQSVSVSFTGHGFTQGSVFTVASAVAVNGITPNGAFPITSITDSDNFVIDTSVLGETATASGSGGGSSATYTCDNLTTGSANWFGIWDEAIHFDLAFSSQEQCRLQYYQSLALLSSSNTTNFLTDRYPQLLRTACLVQAADFMRDDDEYQKGLQRLTAFIANVNVENEGYLRGMELDPEIP